MLSGLVARARWVGEMAVRLGGHTLDRRRQGLSRTVSAMAVQEVRCGSLMRADVLEPAAAGRPCDGQDT